MSLRDPICDECKRVTSGDCGRHGPMFFFAGLPEQYQPSNLPLGMTFATAAVLSQRITALEGEIVRLLQRLADTEAQLQAERGASEQRYQRIQTLLAEIETLRR